MIAARPNTPARCLKS